MQFPSDMFNVFDEDNEQEDMSHLRIEAPVESVLSEIAKDIDTVLTLADLDLIANVQFSAKVILEACDAAINARRDEEMAKLRESVSIKANMLGVTVADLFPAPAPVTVNKPTKAKRKASSKPASEPRFRNPDNHEQTWTGRGKTPAWVEAAGGKEACAIQ